MGKDCEGEERNVVLFGKAEGSGGGCESRSKGAIKVAKGDLEVYGVVGGGGLDYVVFEDGVLREGSLACGERHRSLVNGRLRVRCEWPVSVDLRGGSIEG